MRSAVLALAVGGLTAPFPVAAQIINNFGNGSIRSGVTTGHSVTTVRERSSYTNQTFSGRSFTVTGENIEPGGALVPDQGYRVARPGEPFQFSLTEQEAGLVRLETGGRSTESKTITNTLSVFSEAQ